ncbi:MAG: glycoside hydrolase family 3 C-terminal domain-containing protein [Christensenella sp.]
MEQIETIISQLTLEQKADLCSGLDAWNTMPIGFADVPSVLMTDGPHGLRKQYDKSTAVLEESIPATCYPAASTTACSWDRALLKELGAALGGEAREQGVSMVLGPGINIKRSPLCGRNFEYFSEDPLLAGELGAAMVDGMQSVGTAACVKHFAVNNREYFRMVSNSVVDKRALREIYLPAFERVIRESKPAAVMSAYNMIDGIYCGESKALMQDLLRDEWEYDGLTVSDWGACYNRERGIAAGLDLEMPYSGEENTNRIINNVENGNLSMEALDKCVRRILTFVFQCEENKKLHYICDMKSNHALAMRAAAESAVLLKNDGALPLKPDTKIALLGEFAEKPRYQGAGSSGINPYNLENALTAFKEYGIDYTYSQGFAIADESPNEALAEAAEQTARECDTAVIIVGLPPRYEVEGIDRTHMRIPNNQINLIERIAKIKPVIVLLCGGGAVEMPWLKYVSSLVHFYLGGEAGASAMAQILNGEINPSGKLAESYPLSLADNPSYRFFSDDRHNVEYRESVYVGYRYYDAANRDVLFPFGYGLSYTTFEYSDIKTTSTQFAAGENITVSVQIKNVGSVAGAEVVECYAEATDSPFKNLRGFEKVFLQPDESTRVYFTLSERDFSFYADEWKLFSQVRILVGASSRDIRLTTEISIADGFVPAEYPVSLDGHWDAVSYYNLFHKIPHISFSTHPFTINATLMDFDSVAIGRMLHKFISNFVQKHIDPGGYHSARIMLQLLEENPMRVLVSMSGGLFTYGMARGVLMIVNGQIFMGILAFFVAAQKRKKQKVKSVHTHRARAADTEE